MLRDGEWEVTWNSDLKISFAASDIPDVIARFDQRRSKSVWFERDESIELFGVSVPVGRVRYHIHEALLANRSAALTQARSAPDQKSEIVLEFTAGENRRALVTYVDWKEGVGSLAGLSLVASSHPAEGAVPPLQVAVDAGPD